MTGNWLLIDDIRDVGNPHVIVRTTELAMRIVIDYDWEGVIFDHDLGNEDTTGYTILVHMLVNGKRPKIVQLVTDNPVGRDKMEKALIHHGYIKKNAREFYYAPVA